ncbi:hypothetical protein CYLTODRAFT_280003 [Cylindrobasidium torrendii FP15055 ss-10]|uniref:Uncharacterized protein n=1 Tax=Cylindrobasidium torrendii FP15055 ss-10 TaxID=1314674 RepID=A0A0D7BBE5_9AGAR|nr:hypothetical protein CYLTODRAFT_280003 [Cylindrobasidium torrendii FP15055 ss-10]
MSKRFGFWRRHLEQPPRRIAGRPIKQNFSSQLQYSFRLAAGMGLGGKMLTHFTCSTRGAFDTMIWPFWERCTWKCGTSRRYPGKDSKQCTLSLLPPPPKQSTAHTTSPAGMQSAWKSLSATKALLHIISNPRAATFGIIGLLRTSATHILCLHFVSWNIHPTDRSQAMPILPSPSSAHHPRFSNTQGTLPRPQRRVTCAPMSIQCTGEQSYGDQDAAIGICLWNVLRCLAHSPLRLTASISPSTTPSLSRRSSLSGAYSEELLHAAGSVCDPSS